MHRRLFGVGVALAAALGVMAPAWSAPPIYRITDLGVPDGYHSSAAVDINERGEVLGNLYMTNAGDRPFVWSEEAGMRLWDAFLENPRATLGGINNSSQVAGTLAYHFSAEAFAWSDESGLRRLSGLMPDSSTVAEGINDTGAVTGGSVVGIAEQHAVVWARGAGVVDLHPPGARHSRGLAINNLGQVAGYLQTEDATQAAVMSADTPATKLACVVILSDRHCYSTARSINDLGQVVGTVSDGREWSFIWTRGSGMRDLAAGSAYADYDVHAEAINLPGQVVGAMTVGFPSPTTGFYWDEANGIQDVMNLIDPADPLAGRLESLSVTSINDEGTLVGNGVIDGVSHALVLTPID